MSLKGDFVLGDAAEASVVSPLTSGDVARLMISYGDNVRMLCAMLTQARNAIIMILYGDDVRIHGYVIFGFFTPSFTIYNKYTYRHKKIIAQHHGHVRKHDVGFRR